MRPDIAAIEARHQKATPGEWTSGGPDRPQKSRFSPSHVIVAGDRRILMYVDDSRDNSTEDFTFVAAAHQDIPDLVARCRELERAIKAFDTLRELSKRPLHADEDIRVRMDLTEECEAIVANTLELLR